MNRQTEKEKDMKKLTIALATVLCVALLSMGLAACNLLDLFGVSSDQGKGVTKFSLEVSEINMTVGERKSIPYNIEYEGEDDVTIFWSSSNTSVATVYNGEVEAVGGGMAVITAEADGKTDTCVVNVTENPTEIKFLSMTTYDNPLKNAEDKVERVAKRHIMAEVKVKNPNKYPLHSFDIMYPDNNASYLYWADSYFGDGLGGLTETVGQEDGEWVTTINFPLPINFNDEFYARLYLVELCFEVDGNLTRIGITEKEAGVLEFGYVGLLYDEYGLTYEHTADDEITITGYDPDVFKYKEPDFSLAGKRNYEGKLIPFVTAIGDEAFMGCSDLKSMNFGENSRLQTIGDGAFMDCSSLNSLKFGENSPLKTIGDGAFKGCVHLNSIGSHDNLIYIGSEAFWDCKFLKEMHIPSGVTEIKDGTFYNCAALQAAEIHDDITAIGSYAFYGCKAIPSVKVPEGITTIEEGTFYGCGARKVEIPTTLTTVKERGFGGMGETHITDLEAWCRIDFYDIYSHPGGMIVGGGRLFLNGEPLTELVIPESVTEIKNNAFNEFANIESVRIHAGVTRIGENAFAGCTKLNSVIMSDSVKTIGTWAFRYCERLENIDISDGVTYIGEGAFSNCASLKTIEIPSSLTEISREMFFGCVALESVTFRADDMLTSISESAFYGCNKLSSIVLPSSITSVNIYAFSGCNGLNCNEYGGAGYIGSTANPYLVMWKAVDTDMTSCTVHESTVFIMAGALSGCKNLVSVEIPCGVTAIGGNSLFNGCDSLETITVQSGNEMYHSDGNCIIETATGTLIAGCKSSVIPEYVTSIGDSAFYGCNGITSIVIPKNVVSIGRAAFYRCGSLKSVSFEVGSKLTSIDGMAFAYCPVLESVEIPSSVTSIGSDAFYQCPELASVVFGDTQGWIERGVAVPSEDLADPRTAAARLQQASGSWTKE